MSNWVIALAIKPFVLLALGVFVLHPIRRRVERWKDSRLKRVLLFRWD